MNEADLLDRVRRVVLEPHGIAPYKPIVQVDSEPDALGRFHPVTVPAARATSRVTRAPLLDRSSRRSRCSAIDQRADVAERRAIWRAEKDRRAGRRPRPRGRVGRGCSPRCRAIVPGDAVIAVDVGNNTYSFGRYFECKQQSVLMSGYLGSIGFGYPAAMGAWAAAPDRPIVAVTGDGGFGQYLAELNTPVKYRMNITHVVLDNGQLGKITKEQRAAKWDVWQTSLHNPSFAAVAGASGLHAQRVEYAGELDAALRAAFDTPGPALVELITDAELI